MSIMDPLVVDEALTAVLERDWEGGIDNEGLDISQLESYINNDDTSDATLYFGDLQGVGDIKALGNATPRESPSRHLNHHNHHHHHSNLHQHNRQPVLTSGDLSSSSGSSSSSMNGTAYAYNKDIGGGAIGIHGGGGSMPIGYTNPYHNYNSAYKVFGHHLPESPPDSGSEPPYSPPDHPNLSPHQKNGLTELYPSPPGGGTNGIMAFPYPVMQAQLPLQHSANQTHAPTHTPSHNPSHNPTHTTLQPHNPNNVGYQQPVMMGGTNMGGPGMAQNSSGFGAAGNPVPSMGGVAPTSSTSSGGVSGTSGGGAGGGGSMPIGKKRKMNDSGGLTNVMYIKEDPDQPATHQLGANVSSASYCEEDEYTMDSNGGGPYLDGSYQCIKFHNFQPQNWSTICDVGFKELPLQTFRVDADKGFNFSNPDDAFVCQKKNHFQVTVHIQTSAEPIFVKTPEGLQKIDRFYVHFFGVKTESPSQAIRVEQSQSDRTKKAFHPVPVDMKPDQTSKITVGRLHFSETTSNNMRKKGKPNPDQRYFYLVVSLKAHCGDNAYPVAAQASEKIIVRASNPGQFESDVEYTFQRGTYPESIYHMGRVGVNTDRPDEALVINGNLKVTGQLLQPSDRRAKKDVTEVDTKEQLKNVSNLRVVSYSYKNEFADTAGLKDEELYDTGVIAQEVKEVIPDAVKTTGDLTLSNGDKITNFLLVNKDRIFMENVGAVKELCKVTGNLENRIGELEKMNKKIAQLKRMESFKSTTSSVSTRTSGTGTSRMSSVSGRARGCTGRRHKQLGGNHDEGICNNKTLQLTTITLVCIMAFCLMAMATIYILDYRGRNEPGSTSITPTTTPTTIILSSSMASSTNQPYTTTNPAFSTDDGTLTSLMITTKPTYGTTTTPGTFTPPQPPIIGRPENCEETTPGDDPICEVFCCVEDTHSAELLSPIFPSPSTATTSFTITRRITHFGSTTVPPTMSRYSEVFTNKLSTSDPNTVNDSTTQAGIHLKPIPSKKSFGHDQYARHRIRMSRPSNSRSIKQILSKRSIQTKRSTSSSPPHHKPQPNANTRIPTIEIVTFNTTITHLYCLNTSLEYQQCLADSANNYTYRLPISRFMTQSDLTLSFSFLTPAANRQVYHCPNCSNCGQSYPSVRCGSSGELPYPGDVEEISDHTDLVHSFTLFEVGMWRQTSYKFRIPVDDHVPRSESPCRLGAETVGTQFYEINMIFERVCNE